VRALAAWRRVRLVRVSPVYETSPVGPRQRAFLNAVVELRTGLDPAALLAALKCLEAALGRRPGKRWGPREIDADLIFHGRWRIATAFVQVPHPRWAERKFVLKPLADLAPGFRDPATGATARAALARLTDASQKIRLFSTRLDPGRSGPRRKK
jgi:2-amino-4-hydroxy-6-hydroxymethyldihydropteridine diphosphokinase